MRLRGINEEMSLRGHYERRRLWGNLRERMKVWGNSERKESLREFWVKVQFSSVQSLSRVWLFATPWITARQASLSSTNSRSSPRLMSIESVMPSSHLILCCPFLLLPPVPPNIRVFSNESTLGMRWPKYWRFSFSIIPSKEIPGLISFRMDCLDLLAVQGTLKSLLQNHSSKAWVRVVWGNFGQGKWQRFLRELGFSEISERNSEWWGYEKILRKWD